MHLIKDPRQYNLYVQLHIMTTSGETKPDFVFVSRRLRWHTYISVNPLLPVWYHTSINFLKTGCWFVNVISLFSQTTFTCAILYKYQLFKDGLLISKISHDLSIVHLFLWYYFVWSIFPYIGTVWRYQRGNQKIPKR